MFHHKKKGGRKQPSSLAIYRIFSYIISSPSIMNSLRLGLSSSTRTTTSSCRINGTSSFPSLSALSSPFLATQSRNYIKIRLQRFGRRNLPYYRIVVANTKSPRDGKFIERVCANFIILAFCLFVCNIYTNKTYLLYHYYYFWGTLSFYFFFASLFTH